MRTSPSTFITPKQGEGTTSTRSLPHIKRSKMQGWRRFGPCSSLLPLRHLQGGGEQVDHLRSAHAMQAQFVHVHLYMATTITFVIHIVMKGKSPPSIMCTTTTNANELKHDNDIIIMKMLHKRKCTSPNKPYFTPSRSFISTREDRETSTTKTALRLQQPLRHLRQVLSRHLRLWTYGIFAYFPRVRLHRLHQVQGDYL